MHIFLRVCSVSLLAALAACDGGSCRSDENGLECEISGSYRASFSQSGPVRCGNGFIAGGGVGTQTREADVKIERTDSDASAVQLDINECSYVGEQTTSNTFELFPTSDSCGDNLELTVLSEDMLEILLLTDSPPEGSDICVINEQAVLTKLN